MVVLLIRLISLIKFSMKKGEIFKKRRLSTTRKNRKEAWEQKKGVMRRNGEMTIIMKI